MLSLHTFGGNGVGFISLRPKTWDGDDAECMERKSSKYLEVKALLDHEVPHSEHNLGKTTWRRFHWHI